MSQYFTLKYDITTLIANPFKDGIRRVSSNWFETLIGISPNISKFKVDPVDSLDGFLSINYSSLELLGIKGASGVRSKDEFKTENNIVLFPAYDSFTKERNVDFDLIKSNCKIVSLVYDILPIQHPEWFPNDGTIQRFERSLYLQFLYSDMIIVNSNIVYNHLVKQMQVWNFDASKIMICKVPLSGTYDLASRQNIPKSIATSPVRRNEIKRILSVGTIEPRKGHIDILKSFDASEPIKNGLHLTLVGRLGWDADSILKQIKIMERKYPNNFNWLQNVSNLELENIYTSCQYCVIASYDEGFGLPVVEALDRQKVCVVRNIPVLVETSQQAAITFGDYGDFESLKEVFLNLDLATDIAGDRSNKYRKISQIESVQIMLEQLNKLF